MYFVLLVIDHCKSSSEIIAKISSDYKTTSQNISPCAPPNTHIFPRVIAREGRPRCCEWGSADRGRYAVRYGRG